MLELRASRIFDAVSLLIEESVLTSALCYVLLVLFSQTSSEWKTRGPNTRCFLKSTMYFLPVRVSKDAFNKSHKSRFQHSAQVSAVPIDQHENFQNFNPFLLRHHRRS
jgi:hypothetical protein